MITSKEILKKTGLKSTKTLKRWERAGFIPKPVIGTHPSGRGTMNYWPDWVLDLCLRITEHKKKGHSPRTAAMLINLEKLEGVLKGVENFSLQENAPDLLPSMLVAAVLDEADALVMDQDGKEAVARRLAERETLDAARRCFEKGYHPVVLFRGGSCEVVPDQAVSFMLLQERHCPAPFLVIPLEPLIEKVYALAGQAFVDEDGLAVSL